MQKIAILTDSASDISKEIVEQYNIKVAPFRIIYSDKEFEDKVDISPEEVYSSLEKEIPTTSLPNVARIESILNELELEGYTHVISINISSALSGTSNSIRLVLEDHPNLKSFVYDTKTLTMAEGSIVIEAAKMIQDGKSFEEIIEALPKHRERVNCYFTLSTLEYLKKGGRIGKVAGTIGEILSLKPIIHVGDDGVYHTYSKVRGRNQSINKIREILNTYLEKGKCNLWVLHGDALKECNALYESVKNHSNINKIFTGSIGPALGVHTGPGLVGFVLQEVE
ncbi:DegV family protein [Clostridium paraputrificum]|uniref:DegV family protein n=1 Tax=Clostridium TaxID=1485 RepID=UPI003D32E90C